MSATYTRDTGDVGRTRRPRFPADWQQFFAVDTAGYSALVYADEYDAVRNLKEHCQRGRSSRAPMSGLSQFEVLVRGHVEAGDGRGHDVLHTRPDTDGKAEMIDWRLDNLLVEDTLELV